MPRQPERGVRPTKVALSEPALGLGCYCKRIGIGRGHGSVKTLRVLMNEYEVREVLVRSNKSKTDFCP